MILKLKQRAERIPKKMRPNNMFSITVWRAWDKNRKIRQGNQAFGDLKYKTVPVVLNAVPKEELSLRLCRFLNEERRKDGTKYIYFILISRTRLES